MKKTIELSRVRQGEHFTLDGVELVKLDETHMGAFVVAADALPDNCPFENDDDREDANNFCGSHIAKEMERWLRDQHKPIFDATLERPIDLTTMDGMTDYGTPLAVARLLTIDDYRKYRRFIPLASRPFWLATGWTTKSSPFSDGNRAYYPDLYSNEPLGGKTSRPLPSRLYCPGYVFWRKRPSAHPV